MHKPSMLNSALLSLLFLGLTASAPTLASPKADIRQLEQDFNAAYAANDLERYFGFYTDDAVMWFQDGRTDTPSYKKMWADYLKTGAAIKAGTTSDMHIRLSPRGDVAIASYLLRLTTIDADKKEHTDNYQESDVWFKTEGGWKITHVHYSDAPKPKKR